MDQATWDGLNQYKRWGSFDESYPADVKRFYAPLDAVHDVLMAVCSSAKQSLAAAMYGWDDQAINALFLDAWKSQSVRVKLALDSTQAAGKAEKALIALWPTGIIGNDLIIGQSRFHAISHDKLIVADDCVISGSTNLSTGGEAKQNNELTVHWNARTAIEVNTLISLIFSDMQKQRESKLLTDLKA